MKKMTLFAGALACVLLSGCMTEEPIKSTFKDPRITLSGTSAFVPELIKSNVFINDNGLLTANASAYINRSGSWRWTFKGDTKLVVSYVYEWMDATGKAVSETGSFDAMPGNIINFHGVAPAEKYTSFRLKITLKDAVSKKKAAKAKAKEKAVKSAETKPVEKTEQPAPKKVEQPPIQRIGRNVTYEPAGKKLNTAPAAAPGKKNSEKLTEPFN